MPSALAAKKARPRAAPQSPTRVSPPLRPKVLPFTPLPPASTQLLLDIDADNNNKGEDKVEDDDVEEPPSPPPVVRFISIWKAFNRKEVLSRSRLIILDQNILYLTAIKA
jgi:hypothetical protein